MAEIQKADPRAIRAAVIVSAAGVVFGGAVIWLFEERREAFAAWVGADRAGRVPTLIGLMALLTTGPLLGLAASLWRVGRDVVRAGRYPSPRMRLLRDTPIVVGPAAIRRGQWLRRLALVVAAGALVVALMLWRIVVVFD